MLKIYDTNHNAIGHIVKYKDLKVASDVTTGDQTLSFTYMARHHEICEEYYIETQDAEYVVKETVTLVIPAQQVHRDLKVTKEYKE